MVVPKLDAIAGLKSGQNRANADAKLLVFIKKLDLMVFLRNSKVDENSMNTKKGKK